jgi:hypothetical protein
MLMSSHFFVARAVEMAVIVAPFAAAVASPFEGYWEGHIIKGAAKTPIALEFKPGDDGLLTGTLSLPDGGLLDRPIREVKTEGESVSCVDRISLNRERRIDARIENDRLVGTFTDRDLTLDVVLDRVTREVPYRTEDFIVSNGDVQLATTLYVPSGAGPHPAVVHLHGSGDHTRENYYHLADFLARLGVASAIQDKRGCGESGGNWLDAGFAEYAQDGIATVHALQKRSDIDPRRVGMIGISQAGWIMPLAASMSPDVAFIVNISAPSITVEEEGYYDPLYALQQKGYGEDVLNEARAVLEMDRRVTRTGEGIEELSARVRELRKTDWFKVMEFAPAPPNSKSRDWYRRILDYDPVPTLEKVNVPILWIYGEADESVPASRCIEILNRIVADGSKPWTIRLFPGADHVLRVPPKPEQAELPYRVLADGYLDAIQVWVRDHVLNKQAGL